MYVIFGAGEYAEKIAKMIDIENVAFFVDNNNDVVSEKNAIRGKSIYSPDQKVEEMRANTIIIAAGPCYEKEIQKQLKDYGINDYISINEKIYNDYSEYLTDVRFYSDLFPNEMEDFWASSEQFSTEGMFSKQYENEKRLIFDYFLPHLCKASVVADIGCASGEWSSKIAEFCAEVDGYDYSQRMIDHAKQKWKNKNLHFQQFDLTTDDFCKKQYDDIMLFGVLMYMFAPERVCDVLKKIHTAIKPGGVLVTKDTLTISQNAPLYCYIPHSRYSGYYMDQGLYYKCFAKCGFELVDDLLLMKRDNDRLGNEYISRGAVWRAI